MAETLNSALISLSYTPDNGVNLTSQVSKRIVVIFPRGMLVAGFDSKGDLLMAQFDSYKNETIVWDIDFFEQRFNSEKLLTLADKSISIFIASDKYLLVPSELYNSDEATAWLRRLFFVEADDSIETYKLYDDNSRYLFTCPGNIKNVVSRYFPKANILPLAAYQLRKPYKSNAVLQCCISAANVCATVYKKNNVQWHQVFAYENAEDIAYQINLICDQYNIPNDQLELHGAVIHKDLNEVLHDLTQYFPKIKYGSNARTTADEWAATSVLLQQLYSCAS